MPSPCGCKWSRKYGMMQFCPLHAAAADLLTACEKLDQVDCCDGYSLNNDDYKTFWDALNMAREAITKTKGK